MDGESEHSENPLRVGIVDNDPYAVDYLEILFRRSKAPLRVLWTTTHPENALNLCGLECGLPQVVLTDMSMPSMMGIDFARKLTQDHPQVYVVGITALSTGERAEDLQRYGISALLNKDDSVTDIVRTLGRVTKVSSAMYWPGPGTILTLNDTECEIFRLFSQGRTLDSIAVRLGMSPATVKVHMKRGYAKLNAHSRTEAIAICIRDGLI
ncbi:response regulator transcription factor [Bifidobacterium sp.]|uniref:response regulator transcription factor n=1 Tax=Bifidobacterium sp. TaxID=41200 RepID=UPI0025BE96A6|nr:response regulator transcription factor [Bifidobacterium sp.]MCI1635863.1 response regulator transcription factor [Bifidobacterium sp.]